MTLALYVIGTTAALLLVSARLRASRDEVARMRDERDAYSHGVAMSLACLLAGLAAAHWYAPPGPAARPEPDGSRAWATAGAPDSEAAE